MADLKKAVAYLRTSSAANVGEDKDSDKRQRVAIAKYARAAGYVIVDEYYDKGVAGTVPVGERAEFAHMIDRLLSNGANTIIVESPDRFARDLFVQLAGHKTLDDLGVTLIAASAPQHFVEDTPSAVLFRQMIGAFGQFEKTTLVAKLKASRDRKRKATGQKVEGRKSHVENRPDVVALAKALRRKRPNGAPMSLRAISAALAAQGYVNARGAPYNSKSVLSMLTGPRRAMGAGE
jgi:DNA invertase Pin-like site-specific DNA recombinase